MDDVLVIGYGNELRGDDGLGPHVARAVAAAHLPGVRVLIATQLVPEFAADLAQAKRAVFVDASEAVSELGVELRYLVLKTQTDWSTHCADPRPLLALTQAVYGRAPEAWWLTASGWNFDVGQGLSDRAKRNAREALAGLKRLIQAKSARQSRPLTPHPGARSDCT